MPNSPPAPTALAPGRAAARARRNAQWLAWKERYRRGAACATVEYDATVADLLDTLGLTPSEYPRRDEIGVAMATALAVLAHWVATTAEGTAWAAKVRAEL